jgi:ATP-dependent Lhr-like helicase
MNAARALLLPATRGTQKRTPFWLQRLRAKDLLLVAKDFDDFPIVAETYRDCLRDVLDMAHMEEVLGRIRRGEIDVIPVETVVPSPVAASLLYDFINQYMYEWDQPKAERQIQALMVGRDMLAQLLTDASADASLPDLLRPEAVRDVDARLQYLADGARARTADELSTVFLALGDLSVDEAAARSDGDGAAWVEELAAAGRLVQLEALAGRHVLVEQADTYRAALAPAAPGQGAEDAGRAAARSAETRRAILRRVLSTHGPLSHDWLLDRYPWGPEWLDAALEALVENGEVVAGRITPTGDDRMTPTGDGRMMPAEDGRMVPDGEGQREYCDRRNLERIHRQTLALLRKEIEPVSIYAYADFLARWQHLHPAERLAGPGALVQLLQQMRGIPAPGVIWERDLLPGRLEAFDPKELEALCQRGEVVWVGSGGKDPRRARIRFLFRGEGSLFLAPEPEEPELSPAAGEVLNFLKSEGACFYADLEAGTDWAGDELTSALFELVMAGLVTNDSLEALRGMLAWSAEADAPGRKPLSSLEAELAAWRKEKPPAPPRSRGKVPPSRARVQAAQRLAARRADTRRVPGTASPRWPGRWGLVHRIGVWGREVPYEERITRQARQLLQCYGIVTRQSLEGDDQGDWNWPALYAQFQLMEMRGEVRRGYFVQGLPGVQFALPEAVERLREWTRPPAPAAQGPALSHVEGPALSHVEGPALSHVEGPALSHVEGPALSHAEGLVVVNACDPANLFGPAGVLGESQDDVPDTDPSPPEETDVPDGDLAVPDPARFTRIPANYTVLLRGKPVLLLETGGQRAVALPDLPPDTLRRALKLAVDQIGGSVRRLTLSQWNGQPVLDSPAAPLLEEVGFRREALVYVWE